MKFSMKLAGAVALATATALTSCQKEEIELKIVPVNGVTLTFVPEGGGQTTSFTMSTPYTSEDGKVYGTLREEHIRLKPNTTYNATVTFFSDKTGTQVAQNQSIANEPQVYTVTYETGKSNAGPDMLAELAIRATDKKPDGSPLGLQTTFTTGKAGVETLQLNLNAEKRQGKSYMGGTVYNAFYGIDVQE